MLEMQYIKRITDVANGHQENVQLKIKNGSGKTLELIAFVPGSFYLKRTVLRLHKRLHKTFYAVVKSATEWLENYRLLFVKPVALIPAVTGEQYDWRKKAAIVDAIPETRFRNKAERARALPGTVGLGARRASAF